MWLQREHARRSVWLRRRDAVAGCGGDWTGAVESGHMRACVAETVECAESVSPDRIPCCIRLCCACLCSPLPVPCGVGTSFSALHGRNPGLGRRSLSQMDEEIDQQRPEEQADEKNQGKQRGEHLVEHGVPLLGGRADLRVQV